MSNIKYEEKQTFKIYFWIIGIIGLVLLAAIHISDIPKPHWVSSILFPIMEAAIVFVMLNFSLMIRIDDRYFTFGFGIIRKKIKLDNIVSCTKTKLKFSNYLGYGIRYGRDGTIAYNTRSGNGIRVKIKDKKRDYILSTNNADNICQIIGKP